MLTIADGGVVHTEGGRGVQEPLILADVICEQPLTNNQALQIPLLTLCPLSQNVETTVTNIDQH